MHYNIVLLHKKLLIALLSYVLWKAMHYNIALLHKKVTNLVTQLLFMESNALHYFCNTVCHLSWGGLLVFNNKPPKVISLK